MRYDIQAELKNLSDASNWAVRMEAIRRMEVVGMEGAEQSIPGLLNALKDESQYVRAAAVRVLGKLKAEQAVDLLIAALDDEVCQVRQNAMWALAEIGAPSEKALPMLESLADCKIRFSQIEMTIAELVKHAISQIEAAVEERDTQPVDEIVSA